MFVHLPVVILIVALGSALVALGVHLLCIPKVRAWRDLLLHGHPASLFVNMMLGLVFLYYGPIPLRYWADGSLLWRGDFWLGALLTSALLLCAAAYVSLDKNKVVWNISLPWIMPACVGVMLATALYSFTMSWPQPIEMRSEPYSQVMPLFLGLLLLVMSAAWWWGGKLVRKYRTHFLTVDPAIFQALLRRAELFDIKPTSRDWTAWLLQALVRAVTTPFIYPFQVAFFMAVTVLAFAPEEISTWGLFTCFSVVVFTYAVSEGLPTGKATRYIIDRAFFFGGQFLVSLFVTVLGAAYWSGRPEVVILLDGASGWHIFSIILAIYCGFWIYENWIHFLLNYHLLGLLNPTGFVPPGISGLRVPYPFSGNPAGSGVEGPNRLLEISGARFLVVGYQTVPWGAFQLQVKSHEKAALFETLVQSGAANIEVENSVRAIGPFFRDRHDRAELLRCLENILDPNNNENGARKQWLDQIATALADERVQRSRHAPANDAEVQARADQFKILDQGEIALHMLLLRAPTPKELAEKLGLRRLEQWIEGYFAGLNVAMISGIGLIVALVIAFGQYWPDEAKQAEVSIDLAAEGDRKFEFKGLHQEIFANPEKKPVILMAGSGGGTRAALFAASVLHGLKEQDQHRQIRLCSGVSGGSAAFAYFSLHYDKLVDEQDQKTACEAWRTYLEAMAAPYIDDVLCGVGESRIVLGKVRVGTLLADSFKLHWNRPEGPAKRFDTLEHAKIGLIFNTTLAAESDYDAAKKTWQPVQARASGSRLILTNAIDPVPAFFDTVKHVVLNEKNIGLPAAAALSANFPPVFSNAMVEIRGQKRYWVTDGGASENQGLVSLLGGLSLVLKSELMKKEAVAGKDFKQPESDTLLPPLYLVAADAGALSVTFSDDRGFQPMQYSCGLYAEELEGCLIKELTATYRRLGGKLSVHRLPMPEVFRGRDGVKTHWMLADRVTFSNPAKDDDKTVALPKDAVKKMIRALYQKGRYTGADLNLTTEVATVQAWIDADERYPLQKKWTALVQELNGR